MEFPLPFAVDLLPADSYLVGGAVRDALLGRQSDHLDLDLVVPTEALALGRKIAQLTGASFVLLDAERSIARLVFPAITVDIAQRVGNSLGEDLGRRDYCMNAIAYDLNRGQLRDPLGGQQDLEQKQVRMVSAENLRADPLRLLRGYRQAAQLGFTLEATTAQTIQSLGPHLFQAAAERIWAELRYLVAASIEGELHPLLGAIELLATQAPELLRPTLAQELQAVQWASRWVAHHYPALWSELQHPLRPSLPTTGIVGALLAAIVRPAVHSNILGRWKASRAEILAIKTAILAPRPSLSGDIADVYELFQSCHHFFPIFVIIEVANSYFLTAITASPESTSMGDLGDLIDRYLDPDDPLAHPVPLLKGNELMQELGIGASPLIGRLLHQIQLAHIRGEIKTQQEAVTLAKTQLAQK